MSMIFISYRKKDCALQARALFLRLEQDYPDEVFLDDAKLIPGDEFEAEIEAHLHQCRVLLALIGPRWHQAKNDDRHFCLDDGDWFRREIALAFRLGVRVVPVLIDGAPQPDKQFLPPDLHPLPSRHWANLDTHNRFDQDIDYLLHTLRKVIVPAISPISTPADGYRREADAIETTHRTSELAPKSLVRPRNLPPLPKIINISSSVPEDFKPLPELSQRIPKRRPEMRWASNFGLREDGELAWADLRFDKVVQRLRWIAPGSFVMGDASVGPAHPVRITKGFWLADTACTQEFWSAVIGRPVEKTSDDAQNPVRHVSWRLIQEEFLTSLNRRLTSMEASVVAKLPSEAQWEYACRAGALENFSFKPENMEVKKPVNKKQVNCDGWYGQVVVAKHLDPNPWGLYQMHGNVWEWCRDAHRVYVMDVVQNDPLGREDGYTSVLKGGSWRDPVWQARSAARRCGVLRSHCGDDVGFRFLLEPCG